MQRLVFSILLVSIPTMSLAQSSKAPVTPQTQIVTTPQRPVVTPTSTTVVHDENIVLECVKALKIYPGNTVDNIALEQACAKVQQKKECVSVKGTKIFHFDKTVDKPGQKILVFSLIHGDEMGAGAVGRLWMERLMKIDPRNSWRIVPVLNPDGVDKKTRTNANNIDLNRNFPTRDWDQLAQKYWHLHGQSSPRRFPGNAAGSEPETQCAMAHITEYKPDFIVSVHTPLNVLDFDGPAVTPPKFNYLPWKSLGHFPGSLGRYMWFERSTPVLTAELKPELPKNLETLNYLQDIVGTISGHDDKMH